MYQKRQYSLIRARNQWLYTVLSLIFLSSVLALVGGCAFEKGQFRPKAVDGIIDLSKWDFAEKGTIKLEGDWDFYWQQLLVPGDFADGKEPIATHRVSLPGGWTSGKGLQGQTESLPGIGWGTYLIKIKFPPGQQKPMGFYQTGFFQNYHIFIFSPNSTNKPILDFENGLVGSTPETTAMHWARKSEGFELGGLENYYLLLQVSHVHQDDRGTLSDVPYLGFAHEVKYLETMAFLRTNLILGMLIAAAIYSLSLFVQRNEDKGSLYLSLFTLFHVIRFIGTEGLLPYLWNEPSQLGHIILVRTSFVASVMSLGFLVSFYRFNFSQVFSLKLEKASWLYCVVVGFILLVVPFKDIHYGWIMPFIIFVLIGIICLINIIRGYLQHIEAAKVVIAAHIVIVSAMTSDIMLVVYEPYDAPFLFHFGLVAFIFLHSQIVGIRFAKAFKQAQHLSDNLQAEVKLQTIALEEKNSIAIKAKEEAEAAHKEEQSAKEEAEAAHREEQSAKEESESAHLATIEAKKESDEAHREADELRLKAEGQAEELKELDKQKTAFFQNMSHELRTPLTLILQPLQNLASRLPNDKEIRVAAKNSRRLLRLVNQLLDFQKLKAGKQDLKLAPLDLNRLTYVCGDYFASTCEAKEVSFSLKRNDQEFIHESSPLMVLGEIDALEKIIFNYLSNALKYTPTKGSIELGLRSTDEVVTLYVKDTGSGISEDGQARLFEVFTQVDDTTTRAYEGSGLGLALVKSLSEEMGGKVGLDSIPGEGSTFWVDFPLRGPAKPLINLLIVEDDPTLRQSLTFSLEDVFPIDEVVTVSSIDDAFEFLDKNTVRCILSDYNLDGGDGLFLLEEISRSDPATKKVLMTGEANLEIMQRALNLGAVDHVFYKPLDLHELIETLKQMVDSSTLLPAAVLDDDFKVKPWLLAEAESHNQRHIEEGYEKSAFSGDGRRVLVIDDLADMRDLLADDLQKNNYEVISTASAKTGLEVVKKYKPDLIITDWLMPEMSGPEFIKIIKSDSEMRGIPVILLTAKSDEDSKLIGTEIGADAFLGKPFNEQELACLVNNLIKLSETSKRELRHTRNLLSQAEQLSQLGALVANVGHEIANPVSLISMGCYNESVVLDSFETYLKELHAESDGEVVETLEERFNDLRHVSKIINTGASRLNDLSQALRSQSRVEMQATKNVDINELIKESMLIAQGRIKIFEITESWGKILKMTCFRSRIGQVITNLLANAGDALSEKTAAMHEENRRFTGRIAVSSENLEREGTKGILIRVSDNGYGVPEKIRNKIFDQFYTTKAAGKGTGLGLSLSIEIVKEHHGQLAVDEDPELGGARFTLWLPSAPELKKNDDHDSDDSAAA